MDDLIWLLVMAGWWRRRSPMPACATMREEG